MNEDQAESREPSHQASRPAGTGHEGVDAVLARLDDLEALPVAEHVTAFEDAHDDLRAALTEARQTA